MPKPKKPIKAFAGRDGTPCLPIDATDRLNAELQAAAARQHGVPPLPPPRRKTLPHAPPLWIPDGSIWFLTLCCAHRGGNELACEPVANELVESARFFHQRGRWFVHLLLIMPDHLHALVSFPPEEQMERVVRAWKKYQATHYGVAWQRDFFDHRLRREESFTEKADYIRMNPVRAGLITDPDDWPYVLAFDGRDGTPCLPPRRMNTPHDPRKPHTQDAGRDGTPCLPQRSEMREADRKPHVQDGTGVPSLPS